jgi:hypothetical protein
VREWFWSGCIYDKIQAECGAAPDHSAALAREQWAIEAVHWMRDTAYRKDHSTGYAGDGPQVMATLPGHQPATHRRDHPDRPHPPGIQPRPDPNPRRHPAIDADLSDFADPVAEAGGAGIRADLAG